MVLQILHTGQSNESLELQGKIIGFGKPRLFHSDKTRPSQLVLLMFGAAVLQVFLIAIAFLITFEVLPPGGVIIPVILATLKGRAM